MADSDFIDLIPQRIIVTRDAWDRLVELVEAPPKDCPKLRELLTRPTVLDK